VERVLENDLDTRPSVDTQFVNADVPLRSLPVLTLGGIAPSLSHVQVVSFSALRHTYFVNKTLYIECCSEAFIYYRCFYVLFSLVHFSTDYTFAISMLHVRLSYVIKVLLTYLLTYLLK